MLYDKALTRAELRSTIANSLQSPEVRQWFDPHWKVFNECTILTYDDETQTLVEKRPDRVVYDGQQWWSSTLRRAPNVPNTNGRSTNT